MPPSAAHPQDWLRPRIHENPKPGYQAKSVGSLAEFIAPEVISKIVVDQYAGPPDDVRRYLAALPTAAAQYFGPSLELCRTRANPRRGPRRIARASSGPAHPGVTFESGRVASCAVCHRFCVQGYEALRPSYRASR